MKNAKNRLKNICKKGRKSSRKNYIYLLNRKSPEISAVWRHFAMENPTKRAVILS